MKEGGPFAFAGLWSTWRPKDGDEITTYTIITTEPNELMATLHNRMPVILGADDHDSWLDLDADTTGVLKPCPSSWLEAYPVDMRVGNVRNNDAGLVERIG